MGKSFTASKGSRIGRLLISILVLFNVLTSGSFVVAASAAPDTFVTKSNVDLPSSAMTNIAYGNNLYIAVGYYGAIIKSTDADNWSNVKTLADVNYTGVTNTSSFVFYGAAYGNGKFVVTGNEGVILTSTDGTNWTQQTSGVTKTIMNVKYLEHNGVSAFYALTEGKLLKSTDGITWTAVVPTGLNATTALTQITVGNNGTRLAVGDTSGFIYSTTNGTTWTSARPMNPDGNPSIGTNMLVWMKDRYYISDPWAYVWTSTDLSTFTLAGAPFKQNAAQVNNQMFNGFYDGTKYYLFGYQAPYGYGAVYTSTDGTSWTMQPYKNYFVTQSSSYLNGKYFRLGNEGLMVSSNGSDWSHKWGGTYNEIIHEGSQYVAVGKQGGDGTIWNSSDLTSWTPATVSARANSFNAVAYGNGKYVAVGEWNQDKTSVATSTDGSAWTVQSGVTDSTMFTDIAFGNGKFVAVGSEGYSTPKLKTSVDGVTWSDPTLPVQAIQTLFSVTFTDNQFIALGYAYDNSGNVSALSIWTSPDGTNWTNRSSSYPNQTDAISDIIYDGSKYILLGYDPSYKIFSRTSDDLATWSAPTLTGNDSLFGITPVLGAKGDNIYALGALSGPYTPVVYYSDDQGTTWQNANVDLTNAQAYSLMSVNGQVIISGNSQLVMTTTSPVSSTISPDTANFDKRISAQADVSVTLTLNGNSLTDIKNGQATLVAGTDYTVAGNTVTIKKGYLAAQAVGATTLTFDFSAGNPQTLAITVSDNTKHSVITPTTGSFDKKISAQADVTTDLTLDGNTLSSIKNSAATLVAGTDYTVTGNNVAIKKSYLSAQAVGTTTLTFEFSEGNPQTLAITVSDNTKHSVITPTTGSFDKKISAQADVTTDLTLDGNTLSSIKNGATLLVAGTDYTVTGTTVAIKKSYLSAQAVGTTTLTFEFSEGNPQTLAITVSDNTKHSVITPTSGSFDKKVSAQADVTTDLTLDGNTLSSIKNSAATLVAGTDYTVTGTTVAIKKSYLSAQAVGTTTLTFEFSEGNPQTLAITVSDNTKHSVIAPTSGSFDKKVSAQADVTTDLTLDGNTLSGIKNGATTLVPGTDYDVNGNTVAIKKEYLINQPVGVTNLTFEFNAGAAQTLTIAVTDSTPNNSDIGPTSANFDKNTATQADVAVTLTLNGNTFAGIENGDNVLIEGTDYTLSGSTVSIKKEYLAVQPVGTTNLAFQFSAGTPQVLAIAITDSTPIVEGPPVLQSAVAGNAEVNLIWTPVKGANGYKIYFSLVSGNFGTEAATVSSSVYSYDVKGLINGATYYFAVRSSLLEGEGLLSNELSATPKGAPGAPTNVTASAGDGQATVFFTPPVGNGGSEITRYDVLDAAGNIVGIGTSSPITVTGLSNGTAYSFTVKAVNSEGSSGASASSNTVTPSALSSGGGNNPTPTPTPTPTTNPNTPSTPTPGSTGVDIIVNGKVEKIGTAETTQVNNQTVTTITVDQSKLEEKLANEGQGVVITIPVISGTDVAIGQLTGQMIKEMEQKQAVLELKTEQATYTLPAQQININSISSQFGSAVSLQDIKVQIEVDKSTPETLKIVENSAAKGQFTIVAPPLEFKVVAIHGDKTIEISKFNAYVERTIAIPDGVDPNKITTGIVVDPDGTVRHVPTKIVVIDGKYFAKVNSLTNSTYSIVWHPIEFKDVANHWSKNAVNNMGSRMVIDGVGNGLFNPGQDITRAEFAAIMVRGLGLKLENGGTAFTDVQDSAWYSRAVQTAVSYNLINGFEDGTFRPTDKITREQAMNIIAKAMKITGLKDKLATQAAATGTGSFTDAEQASDWAKSAIADSLQAGIVSGRSSTVLAPKASITRAEVAAIIERLLQKSDLIQ
jgi:hypothetical protein